MNQIKPLETKVLVGVTDHLDPQVRAMLMAMYSRTTGSILDRLPELEDQESLSQKFGTFYVGYGHKSVGQLGNSDVYFEGVSQLAAKSLENHQLYNGQESSTRYINFSNQPMINFADHGISHWQEKWRDFYIRVLAATTQMIQKQFPFEKQPEGAKYTVWTKTCIARAFDICRAFISGGATTNVGFSSTFDVYNDHFGEMLYHPSKEMQDLSINLLRNLKEKYEYSVDVGKLATRNEYLTDQFNYFYQQLQEPVINSLSCNLIDKSALELLDRNFILPNRQKFQKFDKTTSSNFIFKFQNEIDFGSYRDIHRHRNGIITMPLLTIYNGMNEFYYNNIPDSFKSELNTLMTDFETWYKVEENKARINMLSSADFNKRMVELQYAVPMGYNVKFSYQCDLNQLLYMIELRTSKTVHQTLRFVMQDVYKQMLEYVPMLEGHVYPDMDKENFTLKRGTQTFVGM